jgi:hypothetical protein
MEEKKDGGINIRPVARPSIVGVTPFDHVSPPPKVAVKVSVRVIGKGTCAVCGLTKDGACKCSVPPM